MEYYLPDELVLIGCRHLADSMQPEKNSFLGRARTFVWPLFLFFFRRTERPKWTGTNIVLFGGDGRHCRWRWTHTFLHKHAVVVWCHAQKVIVRAGFAGEAQDSGWTQTRFLYRGTERTAKNSLVPFHPVPQGRIELRHAPLAQDTPYCSKWITAYSSK